MVRDILNRIAAPVRKMTAPIRGLHQAAYLLAGLAFASQLLALLRDRLFAHTFGAGLELDLYYAAFKVPDLVFAIVASLVSAYVLIPRIAGAGKEETRRLLSHTASFLLIGGGIVCGLLALAAPYILPVLFPELSASAHAEEFLLLTRILLIQPILLGLSGIVTSVTQVERRFTLYALSPVLYNIGIIVGTIFLYPAYGLSGIGWGVVMGAVLHFLIHIPVLAEANVMPRLVWPSRKVVMSIASDSLPRSLALGVGALSVLILTAIAAGTGVGSISVFSLAANLAAVPLSLIGASYATAAFPVLAEHMHAKRYEEFTSTLLVAARHIIFWSAIVSVLTLVLRAHIVRAILGTGAFDWDATRLTAAILAVLVLGLIAQGLILLASRAFYATGKSWNPLWIQIAGLVVTVASALGALWLVQAQPFARDFMETLLRVNDVAGTDVLAVALGATIGQLVMAAFALYTLQEVAPGVARSLTRSLGQGLASAIMGASAAYGVLSYTGTIAPLSTLTLVLAEGALAGIVGLTVSAAVLSLLANQEFRDLVDSLRRIKVARALKPHAAVDTSTD